MLSLPAPAKINLFLHILGRRSDGYHNLQTIFQFLDFNDELTFTPSLEKQILFYSDLPSITSEENLVWRAAHLLQKSTNCNAGIKINLKKNIPIGGGVGGGSSDAATTLLALNYLWKTGLSIPELMQLGMQLGADVPIFIFGHAAFAEGVGEKFQIVDPPEMYCLLLIPPCQVATKEIYLSPELTRNTSPITIDEFLIRGGHNDCEPVVRKRYPEIDQAMTWLQQFALGKLSGTGSSIFALFKTKQEALAIQAKMPKNLRGLIIKTMNRSPVHKRLGF